MLMTVDTEALRNPLEGSSPLPWDVILVVVLVVAVAIAGGLAWWRSRRGGLGGYGFTFLEISAAIAVIGALAAAAFPIFINIHDRAIANEEAGIVGAVRSGINNFGAFSEVQHLTPRFPETLDEAGPGGATPANPFFTTVLDYAVKSDWSKIGLVYRGPTDAEYEYDPAKGTFDTVTRPPGYVYGWSMDEGSGTGIGEGDYAGTFSGATWVDGLVGSALRFDGNSGHVHVADSDAIELTDAGTVQAWVNFDSMTPFAGIMHKGDAGDFSDETYTLQLWSGDRMMLGVTDAGGNLHMVQTNTVFQPGQWYHVSSTWDSTGMRIYVNGVLDGFTAGAVVARTSDGGLNIGSQTEQFYNGTWHNLPTQGIIDEAQIYGRSLTAQEIQDYYNSIPH
jgi:prepilin-type N-terminal cleavage/methylation domain-containing protein